jgi:hypothetical protein
MSCFLCFNPFISLSPSILSFLLLSHTFYLAILSCFLSPLFQVKTVLSPKFFHCVPLHISYADASVVVVLIKSSKFTIWGFMFQSGVGNLCKPARDIFATHRRQFSHPMSWSVPCVNANPSKWGNRIHKYRFLLQLACLPVCHFHQYTGSLLYLILNKWSFKL